MFSHLTQPKDLSQVELQEGQLGDVFSPHTTQRPFPDGITRRPTGRCFLTSHNPKTFPRWNYKKANWEMFSHLTQPKDLSQMELQEGQLGDVFSPHTTQRPFPDGTTRRLTGRCFLTSHNPKTFPRWNYKKADWEMFSRLTMNTARQSRLTTSTSTTPLTASTSPCSSETVPGSTCKNSRPYWTQQLQGLEDQVARTTDKVENNPMLQSNIAHKACTAKY